MTHYVLGRFSIKGGKVPTKDYIPHKKTSGVSWITKKQGGVFSYLDPDRPAAVKGRSKKGY